MAGTVIRHLAFAGAVALSISGCENAANPFASKENSEGGALTTEAANSVRLVDRDVESPEVFQTTDTALWDGRPSLGGVWVASPDAVNPERVIIRNEANGKFVIGALFRRERDNPGPKLQISSDAADALGMLAGQPGKVNVTALRREESQVEPAAAVATAVEPLEDAAPLAEDADPIAAAGAALDRADATLTEGATDDAAAGALPAAPLDDLDPTPREGETKWQARKRVRIATRAAKAAAAEAALAAEAGGMDAPLSETAPLEVQPLDGAAIEAAPIEEIVAAPAPSEGAIRIQIGIFSVEGNAQKAADTLTKGGVAATVKKEESNGKTFWSVVASGSGDSKALLDKVKALGFTDAYQVSG